MNNKIRNNISALLHTGFFHVFGSSVINKIISFASSILLVRILSKADYGIYTYADNIMSFFLLASGIGVTSGVLQVCSETKDPDYRRVIYSFSCKIGIITNVLMAVAIIIVALFIPLPIEHSNELLLLMCFIPLATLLSELQRTYLRTELRNKEFSYANTFNSVVVFTLSCLFAFLFRAKGIVIAHYIAYTSTALMISIVYKVSFSLRRIELPEEVKKQFLSISWISMLNNGLSRLMYLLDIFVLGIYIMDDTVIASYKIATIIPTALAFIPSSIIMYVYPYFARHRTERDWVWNNYKKITLYSGLLNTVIAGMLFILAPYLIPFIFGVQYLDALIPFRILSISYAVSGTFRIISGNLLVTQRKLKYNLFIAVFSSAFNTVMNVIFIRMWGSVGAALATILTVITTSIFNTVYLIITIKRIP